MEYILSKVHSEASELWLNSLRLICFNRLSVTLLTFKQNGTLANEINLRHVWTRFLVSLTTSLWYVQYSQQIYVISDLRQVHLYRDSICIRQRNWFPFTRRYNSCCVNLHSTAGESNVVLWRLQQKYPIIDWIYNCNIHNVKETNFYRNLK